MSNVNEQNFPDWYVDEKARKPVSNIRIIGRVTEETLEQTSY